MRRMLIGGLAALATFSAVLLAGPAALASGSHLTPIAQASPGSSSGATAKPGPPWTYQMARIGIGLLILTVLAVAFAYYHFMVRPQRRS